MHWQPTRLRALVVLLLGAVLFSPWFSRTIVAALQQGHDKEIFVPVVYMRPTMASNDLRIVHVGLYQSVQTTTNSVSLVNGKPALLRVFAQSTGATPVPVAEVTVRARRGSETLGALTIGPQAVPANPSVDNLASTFNLDLPVAWLSGDVTLSATIDAVDTIPELDETNNERTERFFFRNVLPLDLTIVPIHYVDSRTGQVYSSPEHDPISEWLLATFPINRSNVASHTPYTFTGDLRQPEEWQRLLQDITTLWAAEVGFGSGHVYYGLIPVRDSAGVSWFPGGISGLGWIGQRVSLGLDFGPETGNSAGHELGHNFGRRHAPCGNPTSPDPHYPYPNASIGAYGVDTADDILLAPHANFDMMSYCGPEWVSDYTYEGLLEDQLARGGRAALKGDGLLLRAVVNGASVTAMPVYSSDHLAAGVPEASGYTAQLLDKSGAVVTEHPAALLEAEEVGVSARMLMALAPAPARDVAAVRFLRGDTVVAQRTLSGPAKREALRATVELRGEEVVLEWSNPGPALVSFSVDGVNWTTIAADVTGGRLALAGEQLPSPTGQFRIELADSGPVTTLFLK